MPKRAPKRNSRSTPARTPRTNRAPRNRPTEPNLLITIQERHRELAAGDVRRLLARIGIGDAKITPKMVDGLLGVRLTHDDPKACLQTLQPLLREDPFAFQHTHRWIPVEEWRNADAPELARFADRANQEILPDESWKVQLTRHASDLDHTRLVGDVAKGIDNPHVDLEHADKTVLTEVVGRRAALAVVDATQQISVDRVLKDEFVRFERVR